MFSYKTYLILFLSGAAGTLVLTPLVRRIALRLKVVDKPDPRKIHSHAVALLGGISICTVFVALVASCMLFENRITAIFLSNGEYVAGIVLCGLMALALGVYDDVRGADAKRKFCVQIAAALFAYLIGIRIEGVSFGPLGSVNLAPLSLPFTILWIVGITNAINIIDGLDGLAAGVTLFVCLGNFFVSLFLGNVVISVISVILAGALVGFLRYNFPPARIFLGNTGSLFLGMVVALASIVGAQKSSTMVMILIPIAVLGLPIVDTSLAIFRRSLLGRPIFLSDKGHIHHALLRLGLSQTKALLCLYGFCVLLLGFAAVVLFDKSWEAVIYLGVIAVISVVGLRVLGYLDHEKIRRSLSNRWRYRVKHAFCRLILLKIKNADSVDQLWKLLTETAAEFELDSVELSLNGGTQGPILRWVNGQANHNLKINQCNERRWQWFGFAEGLGCLRLGYYRSLDEDSEVERSQRLGLIADAAEKRLSELVNPTGWSETGRTA